MQVRFIFFFKCVNCLVNKISNDSRAESWFWSQFVYRPPSVGVNPKTNLLLPLLEAPARVPGTRWVRCPYRPPCLRPSWRRTTSGWPGDPPCRRAGLWVYRRVYPRRPPGPYPTQARTPAGWEQRSQDSRHSCLYCIHFLKENIVFRSISWNKKEELWFL